MLASNQGVLRKSGITSGKDIVNESNKNSAGEIVSPLATYEDEVLIQMAVAGRNDCFSLLMCRHLAAVKKQIRFLISNEADVEDVVQEVVLRVWLHLPTFRSESNLRTWMIRIGINQARQLYRWRKSRPESQAVTDFSVIVSQEESPHQPAQDSQDKELDSPGLKQNWPPDVISPAAVIQPVLQREERSQDYPGGNEDGRVHEDGLGGLRLAEIHVRPILSLVLRGGIVLPTLTNPDLEKEAKGKWAVGDYSEPACIHAQN